MTRAAEELEGACWMLLSLIDASRPERREILVELVAGAATDADTQRLARSFAMAAAELGRLVEDIRECVRRPMVPRRRRGRRPGQSKS
jgi:hypothetical protein